MLCVRQSLIDPGLDHTSVKHVSRVLHGHDLGDAGLECNAISHFVLSDALDSVMDEAVVPHCAHIVRKAFTAVLGIHQMFLGRTMSVHARSEQGFVGSSLSSLSLGCSEGTPAVNFSWHHVVRIFDVLSELASLSHSASRFWSRAHLFECVTSICLQDNLHLSLWLPNRTEPECCFEGLHWRVPSNQETGQFSHV